MNYSTSTRTTTWRCASNQSHRHLNCKAKAYTRQIGNIQKVKLDGEHTHPATNYPTAPIGTSRRKAPKPKASTNRTTKTNKTNKKAAQRRKKVVKPSPQTTIVNNGNFKVERVEPQTAPP